MASLQDQLLKSGLATKSQANKVKAEKRKEKKKKSPVAVDDQSIEQKKQLKAEKDRALNKAREDEKAQKAALAAAKQLVEQHKEFIAEKDDNLAYNFVHHKKVKTLWVSPLQHQQISKLVLSIVTMNDSYFLVPNEIAKRIEERCPEWIIEIKQETSPSEDDPYADYQIPDDLMW